MVAPNDNDQLHSSLQSTYRMISSVFPDGIPEKAYLPLVALLLQGMSYRPLARVLAYCTGKDYAVVYHDALKVDSEASELLSGPEVERIRQALISFGYNEWLNEE